MQTVQREFEKKKLKIIMVKQIYITLNIYINNAKLILFLCKFIEKKT